MTARPEGPQCIDVLMPQLGESVDAGNISRWFRRPGEKVAIDEPLFEVSSDKATMEIPALVAGYVREILAAEGSEVSVGTVVARIGSQPAAASPLDGERVPPSQRNRSGAQAERLSPVVRELLREHGLDAAAIEGTAENGRITKSDVLAYVRIQRERGVANSTLSTERRVALSPLRMRANERLTAAQKNAVNVFSVVEVDLETVALERTRRGMTYLPFIALATIEALASHPELNAALDEANSALLLHAAVHLGVAVDNAQRGLVVPVVREAARLSLDELAAEIARLADGARAAKLMPDEYLGATFTITNNGAFGTLLTAPVLNAPNVAIVSTDAVELRPVVVDRAIVIRHRMYLCMTWDHRACDGSAAAAFLTRIKHNIETWDWSVR